MAGDSCFCGFDASATCLGPCERRVCASHAVLQTAYGFIMPEHPLAHREPFTFLKTIAGQGYVHAPGVRCPDCRNADARVALASVPSTPTSDPVENALWEWETFGRYGPVPAPWGASWAAAAQRRDIPFSITGREGYESWPHGFWVLTTQSSSGVPDIRIDINGMEPVRRATRQARRFRSDHVEVTFDLVPAPANGKPLPIVALSELGGRRREWRTGVNGRDPSFLQAPLDRQWDWYAKSFLGELSDTYWR